MLELKSVNLKRARVETLIVPYAKKRIFTATRP